LQARTGRLPGLDEDEPFAVRNDHAFASVAVRVVGRTIRISGVVSSTPTMNQWLSRRQQEFSEPPASPGQCAGGASGGGVGKAHRRHLTRSTARLFQNPWELGRLKNDRFGDRYDGTAGSSRETVVARFWDRNSADRCGFGLVLLRQINGFDAAALRVWYCSITASSGRTAIFPTVERQSIIDSSVPHVFSAHENHVGSAR
jgi:hypothetical protein